MKIFVFGSFYMDQVFLTSSAIQMGSVTRQPKGGLKSSVERKSYCPCPHQMFPYCPFIVYASSRAMHSDSWAWCLFLKFWLLYANQDVRSDLQPLETPEHLIKPKHCWVKLKTYSATAQLISHRKPSPGYLCCIRESFQKSQHVEMTLVALAQSGAMVFGGWFGGCMVFGGCSLFWSSMQSCEASSALALNNTSVLFVWKIDFGVSFPARQLLTLCDGGPLILQVL